MIDYTNPLEDAAACAPYQQATEDKTPAERQAYHEAHLAKFLRRCAWIKKVISGDERNDRPAA